MDLSQYVNQLREDLASAAAAGDEQTRRTAALLGSAIEPAARLAVMSALSDLAAEVTAALPDHVVEVRLDVRVSVSGQPGADEQEEQEEPAQQYGFGGFGGDAGDISRITLRLVEQIKNQAEQAASQQGMSLNSWLAQTVQGALSGHGRKPGKPAKPFKPAKQDSKRIRGWVQG
jgi:hypothetical protein